MLEIKNSILHVLDANSGIKVISDFELDIDDDSVKKYLSRHLKKADNEYKLKFGSFKEESTFSRQFDEYVAEKLSFVDFSKFIAETIYQCVSTSDKMHSCDVIVCNYIMDEVPKLAILKCNCKVGFTHQVYNPSGGVRNGIINHYAILPNAGQKIDEYVIINLLTYDVRFSDKEYYINGEDTNIMSDVLLKCTSDKAPIETIKLVNAIVEEVAESNGENVSLALSKVKSYINDKISLSENLTPNLHITDLGESVFADSKQMQDDYNEYIKKEKIPSDIKVNRNLIVQGSKTHKIKTDTGIELIVPVDYYQNKDFFEFINGDDGTISISLKNIGKITNK